MELAKIIFFVGGVNIIAFAGTCTRGGVDGCRGE
jgi:hypothetical protein